MKIKNIVLVLVIILIGLNVNSCGNDNEQQKPTLIGSVNIGGTMEVGETLTANITNSNGTAGKFTYKWTRTPNGGEALEITGANGATYVIAESDLEHTLGAIIENEDTQGKIFGTSESKVVLPTKTHTLSFKDGALKFDVKYKGVTAPA